MNPAKPYPRGLPGAPRDITAASDASAPTDAEAVDRALDNLADAVHRRGLDSAAIFLLESVKPLNFIGSQLLHAMNPVASVVFDRGRLDALAETLEHRDSIENLIQRIEAREKQS